jgi:cytochrome c-type biogenesis protein
MTIAPAGRTGRRWPSVRAASAWAIAIAVVGAAVLAARTANGVGAFLRVDQLVAGPAAALAAVGAVLPFGYAFGAGMLAAVNPCGFALLPAYLGLYLGSLETSASTAARCMRALAVAATMSSAFVLTFGAAGLLLAAIGTALGSALPVAGLLVGVGLAAAGAYLLSGGRVYSSVGDRTAARLATAARSPGYRGYAAYGLAYAAASLGCALPIFLTVVGLATAAHDPARSAGQFALYGLGMGFVVTVLTVATALFKGAVVTRARLVGGRMLEGVSGALLVLTGGYVTAYWLALGF